MDNVIFRFNGENQIVSCMYIEQIDDFKQISKIELSPDELLKMYYHFKDKYPEQYIISEEYENGKAITFCDVDYIEMKSYKKQSEAFKKYTKKTSNILLFLETLLSIYYSYLSIIHSNTELCLCKY